MTHHGSHIGGGFQVCTSCIGKRKVYEALPNFPGREEVFWPCTRRDRLMSWLRRRLGR